ncbi:oxidative stress-induced growth inhibitor 1-like isoform X1 [Polypterus senegalus]|uniref:oxidative stress-induced growth inhibitor 1-like isoform X1 n=2 Tax=Polypterus senegalus TaxID=55291 RepID=UPI001965AAD2|nr:oxidative stress-induced growth inhibitor 1-like isoform X1 [Polypterus senegalus]
MINFSVDQEHLLHCALYLNIAFRNTVTESEKSPTMSFDMKKLTSDQPALPVVIVGNGPSAICLSYILSGHRPYIKNGAVHPNPILQKKLQQIGDCPLLDQDLEYLAEGVEGRSQNPMAVLFDSLVRPDRDFGGTADSVLTWKEDHKDHIQHLVLGKGPPGGSWHSFDGSMTTLSLGEWMELPGLNFRDWIRRKGRNLRNDRATTKDVAQYYQHYVKVMGLKKYFASGTLVTSVKPVDLSSLQRTSLSLHSTEDLSKKLYEIKGVCLSKEAPETPFCVYAENVVLATGTYDSPAHLGVDGEDFPFVYHKISDLESAVEEQRLGPNSDPILVVGAGLTAADAVLLAHHRNVPVLHTFRRGLNDLGLIFNQLPQMMYPEYHKVHQMMREQCCPPCKCYSGYRSFPLHHVKSFSSDKTCVLESTKEGKKVFRISMAFVLIGSNPNLSFLANSGKHLTVDQEHEVNCKRNPIDTHPFTYESLQEPGLYAMGPLAGDSFVRFLQGGALAVTASLVKKRKVQTVR